MARIESPIEYKEKFADVYSEIEALGSRVHWFPDRDKVLKLQINFSQFSQDDFDEISFSVSLLVQYILMPAIEDDFPDDSERHRWLDHKSSDIYKAYGLNRLRVGNIGLTVMGIGNLKKLFESKNDFRGTKCEDFLKEIDELDAKENPKKASVQFADKLAENALKVLQLLA